MKRFFWLIPAAMLAVSGATAGIPAATYLAHDKWPDRYQHEVSAADDECHEHHHLQPDGDHDCDDPVGVPEPSGWGAAALLGLGVGGVLLRGRRKRE